MTEKIQFFWKIRPEINELIQTEKYKPIQITMYKGYDWIMEESDNNVISYEIDDVILLNNMTINKIHLKPENWIGNNYSESAEITKYILEKTNMGSWEILGNYELISFFSSHISNYDIMELNPERLISILSADSNNTITSLKLNDQNTKNRMQSLSDQKHNLSLPLQELPQLVSDLSSGLSCAMQESKDLSEQHEAHPRQYKYENQKYKDEYAYQSHNQRLKSQHQQKNAHQFQQDSLNNQDIIQTQKSKFHETHQAQKDLKTSYKPIRPSHREHALQRRPVSVHSSSLSQFQQKHSHHQQNPSKNQQQPIQSAFQQQYLIQKQHPLQVLSFSLDQKEYQKPYQQLSQQIQQQFAHSQQNQQRLKLHQRQHYQNLSHYPHHAVKVEKQAIPLA
jgi:hypothetical protein